VIVRVVLLEPGLVGVLVRVDLSIVSVLVPVLDVLVLVQHVGVGVRSLVVLVLVAVGALGALRPLRHVASRNWCGGLGRR
jgi:hypothetical protein